MQLTTNGQGLHQVVSFTENTIICESPEKAHRDEFSYSLFRYIVETKNLFLLVMDHRLCLILDKRSISDRSRQAFLDFVFLHCPNIKTKKVRTAKLGRITAIITVCMCVLVLIISLIHFTAPLSPHPFSDASETLTRLGFPEPDPELVQMLDEHYQDSDIAPENQYRELLTFLGMGEYDPDTWEWTPGSNGVYWFDAEFFNIESMYTECLRGISALAPEELDFSNIHEDHTHVDWEQGTGTVTVSFDWKDQTHSFDAAMEYDWIDLSALDNINDILTQHSQRQLYFAFDGGQGCLVFYADADWAEEFEKTTGIRLVSDTDSLIFF
jgi:hypothetical protein